MNIQIKVFMFFALKIALLFENAC